MSTIFITTNDRQPGISEHEGERHLEIQVTDDTAFLTIGTYTGTYDDRTFKQEATISVDFTTFVNALRLLDFAENGV